MNCEFCKKIFTTKGNLDSHHRKSKGCQILREQIDSIKISHRGEIDKITREKNEEIERITNMKDQEILQLKALLKRQKKKNSIL